MVPSAHSYAPANISMIIEAKRVQIAEKTKINLQPVP